MKWDILFVWIQPCIKVAVHAIQSSNDHEIHFENSVKVG